MERPLPACVDGTFIISFAFLGANLTPETDGVLKLADFNGSF